MAAVTEASVTSACMEPASRFTSAWVTPGTARVTFSTRDEQAAQVMPVTVNVSFIGNSSFCYYRRFRQENQPQCEFRFDGSQSVHNLLTIAFPGYDTILSCVFKIASMH